MFNPRHAANDERCRPLAHGLQLDARRAACQNRGVSRAIGTQFGRWLRSGACIGLALSFVDCTAGQEHSPTSRGDGGVGGENEAGSSTAVASDAGRDSGLFAPDASAAPSDASVGTLVAVGLNASPGEDALLADLDVIALGARATTLTHRVTGSVPLSETLQRAQLFTDYGLQVLLSLDLGRGYDGPAEVALQELSTLAKQSLDEIFDSELPLAHVVIGQALDLQLETFASATRPDFEALVLELLTYAGEHPTRRVETQVGFHASWRGWLAPSSTLWNWHEAAQAASVSFYGVDEAGRAQSVASAMADLEHVILQAGQLDRPVLFQEVAYPSAESAGSRASQQADFYEELWIELAGSERRVPFVAISAVSDPPEEACEAFVADFGLPEAALRACGSIGLRSDRGVPRPGFGAVMTGIASLEQR